MISCCKNTFKTSGSGSSREQLVQERNRLQQQLEEQVQECDRLKLQLEQQMVRMTDEQQRHENQLEQQRLNLTNELQITTFKQLLPLLVNYPSASRIAQAKPELPAKTFITMFAPLKTLMDSWGYEWIGAVWEQTFYDPKLHLPDADDIQSGSGFMSGL